MDACREGVCGGSGPPSKNSRGSGCRFLDVGLRLEEATAARAASVTSISSPSPRRAKEVAIDTRVRLLLGEESTAELLLLDEEEVEEEATERRAFPGEAGALFSLIRAVARLRLLFTGVTLLLTLSLALEEEDRLFS